MPWFQTGSAAGPDSWRYSFHNTKNQKYPETAKGARQSPASAWERSGWIPPIPMVPTRRKRSCWYWKPTYISQHSWYHQRRETRLILLHQGVDILSWRTLPSLQTQNCWCHRIQSYPERFILLWWMWDQLEKFTALVKIRSQPWQRLQNVMGTFPFLQRDWPTRDWWYSSPRGSPYYTCDTSYRGPWDPYIRHSDCRRSEWSQDRHPHLGKNFSWLRNALRKRSNLSRLSYQPLWVYYYLHQIKWSHLPHHHHLMIICNSRTQRLLCQIQRPSWNYYLSVPHHKKIDYRYLLARLGSPPWQTHRTGYLDPPRIHLQIFWNCVQYIKPANNSYYLFRPCIVRSCQTTRH